jgi:transcriptional regulator PpsR
MQREYSRVRHAETRYRLLFQIASEAVLIVDAATGKIIEANPAAAQLLGAAARRLVGRGFPEGFDARDTRAIETLLAAVRANGRGDDVRAALPGSDRQLTISASLFRQEDSSHFLVSLRLVGNEAAAASMPQTQTQSTLLEVLEGSPDGLVVTNAEGNILTANRAFLELAQLATAEQAKGQPLDRWLGRPGVDIRVLIGSLRQHGSVRLFATSLRGAHGVNSDVEVSAVSALEGEHPCLGFTVRNVEKRAAGDTRKVRELPRSAEELTGLIGRVSLKDLVRETTDVIERMCIEAALELTGDNRATAAEMLGLSRQTLYAKLRRHGLGDLGSDEE